jgi:hypothetical protein
MKASNLLPLMTFSFFTLGVYSTPAHAYQYGDYCRMTQDETLVCAGSERSWYELNGHEPQPELEPEQSSSGCFVTAGQCIDQSNGVLEELDCTLDLAVCINDRLKR